MNEILKRLTENVSLYIISQNFCIKIFPERWQEWQ